MARVRPRRDTVRDVHLPLDMEASSQAFEEGAEPRVRSLPQDRRCVTRTMSTGPCAASKTPCARRRAEREAIWGTLDGLGLATRTRGMRPAPCIKATQLA